MGITAVTPPAGWWVSVATSLFALLVSVSALLPRVSWTRRITFGLNVLSTAVHEGGHALVCCVTGGGVRVIRVDSPDSGVTRFWHHSQFSVLLTTLAGYAMPPLAGLGAAALLVRGHAPMVLALTVAAMLLFLLVTRDLLTLAVVVGIGAVAGGALYWGPVLLQQVVAYAEAWMLLFGEAPGVWVLVHLRIWGTVGKDDAEQLRAQTHVPGVVWIVGWSALIVWCVVTAAPMLLA